MSINLEGGWLEQVRRRAGGRAPSQRGASFSYAAESRPCERASVYAHLEVITQSTFGLRRGAGRRRRKTAGRIHATSPETRRRTATSPYQQRREPITWRARERRGRTMWCFIRHADRISSPPLSLPSRTLTFEARVIFINNRTIISFSLRCGGRRNTIKTRLRGRIVLVQVMSKGFGLVNSPLGQLTTCLVHRT